jgi:hypothetical protein
MRLYICHYIAVTKACEGQFEGPVELSYEEEIPSTEHADTEVDRPDIGIDQATT